MDVINKTKRTTVRSQTTKLLNRIEGAILESSTDEDTLEQFLAELDLKERELHYLDTEIQKTTKLDELESEVIKCDEYNSNLVILKSKVKRAKLKLETRSNLNVSTTTRTDSEERVVFRGSDSIRVNLPKLVIEKFDGDPSDWQRFWDQFDSTIHKNPELSDVEKFNYLRSYLTANAANSIKGYSLTNSNYISAIETLKERFGKKHLVINSHLNKLLSLSSVKKSSDVYALRRLLDTCQTEIRNLKSLGLEIENYSALLAPILIKLLPSDIVLQITKKCGNDEELKVMEIMDQLKTEVISRERTAFLISNQDSPILDITSGKQGRDRQSVKIFPTAAGLINETVSFSKPIKCPECKEKHFLIECELFKNKSLQNKKETLKQFGYCFICLRNGHVAKNCRKYVKCNNCLKRHYKILCPEKDSAKSLENNESTSLSNKTCNRAILMQTLTVRLKVKDKNKHMLIRCLIDTGSQRSYLTKEIINRMGYEAVGEEKMIHSLFGGIQKTNLHKKYKIYISNLENTFKCNFEVYDQEKICTEVPKIQNGPWIMEAKRNGIKFSDYDAYTGIPKNTDEQEISLLIGADIYGKLLTGKIKTLSSNLTAIQTKLGWTLMGKTNVKDKTDSTQVVLSLNVTEAKLTDLWRLDTLGILDPGDKQSSLELEEAVKEHFNKNIKINSEGRYQVSLPWIVGHPPLSSARKIAERRLKNCVDSLNKSGNLAAYEGVFNEWLQEGIIEEVEYTPGTEAEFFLPHRAVIKENSTTRVRPVFDGSAREKGSPSINDCLLKGPNLVELIPSLINRFRLKKIGVISDIRKAFLQISLNENDRAYLRFLWWKEGNSENTKIFQHKRVVFGLTCSPYLLGATLQYHLKKSPPSMQETASRLLESFYIDNCVTSVDNEEQLSNFILESKYILSQAKFDLRGWEHSYSHSSMKQVLSSENKIVPLLGLQWLLPSDVLSIDVREIYKDDEPVTKRKILSDVHKIFDPIGYTCPVTLFPKILLQDLWKTKTTWDSEVPSLIAQKFQKWKKQLNTLRDIAIPRCLIENPDNIGDLSLHTFCDASRTAYATCIYLRNENNQSISCQLIQARCRVAPLKYITIPRMELLACTIGARLATGVKSDLKLENLPTFFWTDSSNALYWIRGSENWAPFVYNCVKEIHSLSKPENWHYVPGTLNPADLPSRGCSADSLKQSLWWEGPDWLKSPQEFWPKGSFNPDFEIINSEKRKTVVTAVNISQARIEIYENTSSYLKMIKVTAWIYRFFENIKKPQQERNLEKILKIEEINHAEHAVLKYAQRYLLGESKPCYTSLQTFIDEQGLIRVKTRISMRKDFHSFRYPIVLPFDYNITYTLIRRKHIELSHAGIQIVMSVLREQFWILRARRTVRKIIKNCVTCQRFTASPAETPSAPLPEERVKEASVFEIVGLDLCGPLFLKNGSKVWVVLFTCAVFRAIHLELVSSLSTENFLLALRRFISRRGRPSTIISDNGRNLVKASSELKSINFESLKNFTIERRIHWKFNPSSAPWWGGFFKRMIGMLKSILRKVLGKASLNYEE